MSLIRMFMTTVAGLVQNGQWKLLSDYLALITRIMSASEAFIIPGKPQDKEV